MRSMIDMFWEDGYKIKPLKDIVKMDEEDLDCVYLNIMFVAVEILKELDRKYALKTGVSLTRSGFSNPIMRTTDLKTGKVLTDKWKEKFGDE